MSRTGRPDLALWRYYFIDLPLWAFGVRSKGLERRLRRVFEPEAPAFSEGYARLCRYTGRDPEDHPGIDEVVNRCFRVKIVREADAYASLRMTGRTWRAHYDLDGVERLKSLAAEGRPVIILTGHIGSFFIPSVAFSQVGLDVYPVARTVDRSGATPLATQIYQKLNYRFSEMRFSTRYLFTDFSGKIDRAVVEVVNAGGNLWVAIDFPRRLYPYKRLPVTFFGQAATLPAGIIQWGLRKGARFVTGWNRIVEMNGRYLRVLTIEEPFDGGGEAARVVQTYADRLSRIVAREPWQWMALPVIHQYMEKE